MKKAYEAPLMEVEKFTILNVVTDVSGGVGGDGEEIELQNIF